MRKAVIAILFVLFATTSVVAQYNRDYFFYVGRMQMMNNEFSEAIRTLNILLRFDEEAYEGYFLRGIAKYNLDDLLGAEADFTEAIEKDRLYISSHNTLSFRQLRRCTCGFP